MQARLCAVIREREIARLRALQAMGITPLVARRVLPGAAPSQRLRLKASPPGNGPAQPAGAAGVRPPASPQSAAAQALRDTLTPRQGAAVEVPAPSAPRAAVAGTPTERFRLAVVQAGARLWVEDLRDAVLAREQVDLIASIAAALAHPEVPSERPRVAQFDWPLHGNQQLDLGPDEAAASLSSFLNRQLDERGCVELMCLGGAATQRLRSLSLACARRDLPSTRELLAEPLRKRELWAALRD
jgi:hypothetical protein